MKETIDGIFTFEEWINTDLDVIHLAYCERKLSKMPSAFTLLMWRLDSNNRARNMILSQVQERKRLVKEIKKTRKKIYG